MTVDLVSITVYIFVMTERTSTFTLAELCKLAELPRRTVRYYIQVGLLPRPEGAGRGAHYTAQHLDRLLEIRKWQHAGLSLQRIGELLGEEGGGGDYPPPRPRRAGSLEVCSHLMIADGIELVIEPTRADLSPEQVRALAEGVMALYSQLTLND